MTTMLDFDLCADRRELERDKIKNENKLTTTIIKSH
jgi:hypothetical protein